MRLIFSPNTTFDKRGCNVKRAEMWIRCVVVCVSVLLLSCHHRTKTLLPIVNDGIWLPNRVDNTSDMRVASLVRTIRKGGVIKVVSIGSDYLLSIPTAALFNQHSPQLKWSSYGYLNQSIALIKQFREVSVTVTAYATPYISTRREKALTLARAREVALYLLSQGVDSRFIFAEAAGSEKPITADTERGEMNSNSRIEITFRNEIA